MPVRTQGAGLSVGQENTVNELLKDKDELSAERERQVCAGLRGGRKGRGAVAARDAAR